MTADKETEVLKALSANPRSLATEVGATSVEMYRLEKEGKVQRAGQRETGKPGRPPVEWVVFGDLTQEEVEEVAKTFPKGMPKLPNIDAARPYLRDEARFQVEYIENMFKGFCMRGIRKVECYRELDDYKLLAKRYKRLVNEAKAPVAIEFEDLGDDA